MSNYSEVLTGLRHIIHFGSPDCSLDS